MPGKKVAKPVRKAFPKKVAPKKKAAPKKRAAPKKTVSPKAATVCLEGYKISKAGKCIKDKKYTTVISSTPLMANIAEQNTPAQVAQVLVNAGIPPPPPNALKALANADTSSQVKQIINLNAPAPPPMPMPEGKIFGPVNQKRDLQSMLNARFRAKNPAEVVKSDPKLAGLLAQQKTPFNVAKVFVAKGLPVPGVSQLNKIADATTASGVKQLVVKGDLQSQLNARLKAKSFGPAQEVIKSGVDMSSFNAAKSIDALRKCYAKSAHLASPDREQKEKECAAMHKLSAAAKQPTKAAITEAIEAIKKATKPTLPMQANDYQSYPYE